MSVTKIVSPFLICLALSMLARAQGARPWETVDVVQPGQTTIHLADPFGGFCGIPVEVGDFDADGFPDWAVAPILTNAMGRTDAGEVVIYKGNGTIGGILNDAALPLGQPLARIQGAAVGDLLGTEIFAADMNGDGIDDLLIGASGADPMGRNVAGACYLIPGGPGFSGIIDLASPPPGVVSFFGADATDRLGFWVESGDLDGDGLEDMILTADDGNGPTNNEVDRGEAYIVWGGQALPSVIDFAAPPMGLQVTIVYGVDNADQLGSCAHATDLDADGYEDLIVSAAVNRAVAAQTGAAFVGGDGPGNSRNRCGDTYVLWGGPARPATIDLNMQLNAMLTAGTATLIYGADVNDVLGEELSSGDFDGDGYRDLVLGALTADGFNNATSNAGDGVIIWGGPQMRGQTFDMQLLPAGTTTIYGSQGSDILADTLSGADVNGDGFDDLFIALPGRNVQRSPSITMNDAGEVLILFGGPVRWPSILRDDQIDANLDVVSRRIWGTDAGDLCGYSMEGEDIDQDGFADIFPNMMRADGFQNMIPDAGDVVIVSGQRFSRGIATPITKPQLGTAAVFQLVAEPTMFYGVAFALGATPSQVVPGSPFPLYLAPDALFALTTQFALPEFMGFTGFTDPSGVANYALFLPNQPAFAGIRLFTAFATFNLMTQQFATISATTSFVLEL